MNFIYPVIIVIKMPINIDDILITYVNALIFLFSVFSIISLTASINVIIDEKTSIKIDDHQYLLLILWYERLAIIIFFVC